MPKITFRTADGREQTIVAVEGHTVMESALRNNVDGIIAECGGACACATCHVYVDDAWLDVLPAPNAMEQDMLDFSEFRQDNSRLSCQIRITPALDGLQVTTPADQG